MSLLRLLCRLRIVLLVLIVVPVLGCSDRALYEELRRLCEKDGGVEKFGTVEAPGYFYGMGGCFSCWRPIVDSGFEFVEICNESPKSYHAITEPGCWRLTSVERKRGNCHAGIDRKLLAIKAEPYVRFSATQCIVAQKITEPSARYGTFIERSEWDMGDGKGSLMRRFEDTVRDLRSHEIIAREVEYEVAPDPSGNTDRVMTRRCHYVIEDFHHIRPLVAGVIKSDGGSISAMKTDSP